MEAAVIHQYGGPEVVHLEHVEKPVPREDQVLIKVHASSINSADWRIMRADPFMIRFMAGMFRPSIKVLGSDISGIIESVGSQVTDLKVGDAVFGNLSDNGFGAYAEYAVAPASKVVHKPENLSFEQAAALPLAGLTALQAVRDVAKVAEGHKVLVNGAGGGVGTLTVQLAKFYGAEVTASCSTKKIELMQKLGVEHVIDYTQEDSTAGETKYDVILDCGAYRPVSEMTRALKPDGRYVIVGGSFGHLIGAMFRSLWPKGPKVCSFIANTSKDDLLFIKQCSEKGDIVAVIDRKYPLAEISEAMKYFEVDRPFGKVVIKMTNT